MEHPKPVTPEMFAALEMQLGVLDSIQQSMARRSNQMEAMAQAGPGTAFAGMADSQPLVRDWTTPRDPVEGLDNIMQVYAQCMGTTPGPDMARTVRKTKEMLFDWWGANREVVRAALVSRSDDE